MAQLMPLPLTVSCSSKIQIGFTFLVPAHLGTPGQRASLQTDNHATTPPLSFLQGGCPSCRPTNSVKALKAN